MFYRLTDLIFHHGIDVSYVNGALFKLTSPFQIRLTGYIIFLIGGVVFSYLFTRFIPRKNSQSGVDCYFFVADCGWFDF
jgi:hypothetical protein